MKKLKLFTIVLLALVGYTGYAQEKFMVTKVSGESWINNTKLAVGSSFTLGEGDKLYVYNDLILRHLSSGGTIKIPKAATYSMKELSDGLKSAQQSSGDKLVAYVVGEVVKDNENINDNHRKYMRVTGSVERASNIGNLISIEIFLNEKHYRVYNTKSVTVIWHPVIGENEYIVTLMDHFDNLVLEKEVSDTLFNFDLENPKFEDFSAYCVISVKGKPEKVSEKLDITRITDKDAKFTKLDAEYKAFKLENNLIENDAQSKITEAYFFEKVGCYADVIGAYVDAIKLSKTPEEKAGIEAVYTQFMKDVLPVVVEDQKKKKTTGNN